MFFPVAPIFLAAQLIIGVADKVPRFNIDANCDAEAAASAGIAASVTVVFTRNVPRGAICTVLANLSASSSSARIWR